MNTEREERAVRREGARQGGGAAPEVPMPGSVRGWRPPAPWREVEWETSGEADVLEREAVGATRLTGRGREWERGAER